MQLSLKTRVLNLLRTPLTLPVFDPFLIRMARGSLPESVVSRVLPRHYQFAFHSMRKATRYGIQWPSLDLSDIMAWYLYYALYDPSHEDLLNLVEPGSVVIDVGANIGVTALRAASKAGPSGHVFAFEPDPDNFTKLCAAIDHNPSLRVSPKQLAVGDSPGELALEIRDRNNLGMNRISPRGERKVTVVTIDDFVDEQAVTKVHVIKVDVEGFELAVLTGAGRTLKRDRPRLFLELDDTNLRDQGTSAGDLLRRLRELGYACRRADGGALDEIALQGTHTDLICVPE